MFEVLQAWKSTLRCPYPQETGQADAPEGTRRPRNGLFSRVAAQQALLDSAGKQGAATLAPRECSV